jgi:hypothetical protein
MNVKILKEIPLSNNTGRAIKYELTDQETGEVSHYHCSSYDSGDKHVVPDRGTRIAHGVKGGTFNGLYNYNYGGNPKFKKELDFLMDYCGIPKQGGKKTLRRNRKRRLRTRKSSHKKFALSSSN